MSYNGKPLAQLAQELDPVLSYVMNRSGLQTLHVAVNVGGEAISLAYREGAGRIVDGETPLYAVGCVMDMIFAIISVDMHHRLGLPLNEPLETFVPEVIDPDRHPDWPPITLQHLLTRTSGIQDPRTIEEMQKLVPWEELFPRIRAAPRLFTPGTAFNYGGIERTLLAAALMKFAGKTIHELAQEIINEPCGLRFREEQYGPVWPDGMRRVRRSDMTHSAKVAACLASGGVDGKVVFGEEVRTYLQVDKLQLSRSVKAPPWPHAAASFTLGLFKYSDGLIGFNGFDSGESCSVRYDPMGEVGFAVGLQGSPIVRDYIVTELSQRLGFNCTQSKAVPCTVGSLNGLEPDDIVGDYLGWAQGYRAKVTREGEQVACDLSYHDHRFRLMRMRLENDAWLIVDSAAELAGLEFYRDARTGRVCMSSGGVPYAKTGELTAA
jgi:hypothetical protein